jgi:hypothetical protein
VAGKQLHEIPVRVSDERDPQSVLGRVAGRPDQAAARLHGTRVGGVEVIDCPGCLGDAGACRLSPWFDGEWNFVSSSRPLPSGVCSIAASARTPSSPTIRSTQRPSTDPSPCSTSPSSTKNSVADARSSTTMPTCSIRWIVMCSRVRNQIRSAVPGAGPSSRGSRSAGGCRSRRVKRLTWASVRECHPTALGDCAAAWWQLLLIQTGRRSLAPKFSTQGGPHDHHQRAP